MLLECEFTLNDFIINNTRSRHTDTDYVSASLAVGDKPPQKATRAMGDLNNGDYHVGFNFQVALNEGETAVFSYAIVNSGHSDPTFIEKQLENAVSSLASKGAQAAATAAGTAIGTVIGAEIGTDLVPVIGTALGALAGWLVSTVGSDLFANCDGPVAAGIHPFTYAQLQQQGSNSKDYADDNPGTDSPSGCGSNSQYIVKYSVNAHNVGWSQWFGLGGQILGPPAVTVVKPGYRDIYVQGTDSRLYQKWWDGQKWNPSDSGWSLHDDGPFRLGSAPSVISQGDTFRDVYVRGQDGHVYHKSWNGHSWSQWFGLGGQIVDAPSATLVRPNYYDIYVQGTDNRLYQKWWDGQKWNPSDEGWALHDDGAFRLGSAPCMISNGDNYREVFVRGQDGHAYHKTWNGKTWTQWFGLGGEIVGAPSATLVHPGYVDIYVQGTDNRLYQKWWDGQKWNPSDAGWDQHNDGAFLLGSAPCVISDNDAVRDIFVRQHEGQVAHKYWNG